MDPRESEGFVVDFRRRWGFFRGFGFISWIHEKVRVLSWIFDGGGVFSWNWTFFVDPREGECVGRGFPTEVRVISWIWTTFVDPRKVRVLSWIFDGGGVFSWLWTFFVDTRESEGFVFDFRPTWGFSVELDFFRGSTKK